jgi:hypothetical protein
VDFWFTKVTLFQGLVFLRSTGANSRSNEGAKRKLNTRRWQQPKPCSLPTVTLFSFRLNLLNGNGTLQEYQENVNPLAG